MTSNPESQPLIPRDKIRIYFLVTTLFFLWGIPNNLNDVLIRQFMKSFAISRFEAGLVQSAFYLGYFMLALPAALMMRRFGYKVGMVTGLFLFGGGCLLFWPAALVQQYGFFLFALFVIASGLAFLETAANPFISELGEPETAERRLNVAQAFNPLGTISGVLIGTIFIFSGVELKPEQVSALQSQHLYQAYLRTETLRVVSPYLVLGCVAFIWAIILWRTKFPVLRSEKLHESAKGNVRILFRNSNFRWAVVTQFMYVGAQVGTWSYFIQYIQEYTHQPEKAAGYYLTGTLVAFGLGRFVSSYLMRYVGASMLMGVYSVVSFALVSIAVLNPGWSGLWAIFATSFFMSLMFPTIFALGLRDLGLNTKIGSSLLVMSIVGGAILTPIMGLISQRFQSIAVAYVIPLMGYAFVALYSFWGSKIPDKGVREPIAILGMN